ncbi:MAG TPA: TetR/AcrR family transcriptional regulator [Herpetosiphonaceae bacterium]|nr:TetR/AcrR family transcriptional regulator [Herpetosiphonaceae bacterium]
MKTPERILAAALELFNEQGTGAVSTNHIADALGISPGNLYYHFRNKEAIIRGLFEQQFAQADRLYALPADRPPTIGDLQGLVRATFAMSWEFRFIYRELITLLRRDPDLQARWVAVRARGFAGFRELVAQFVAAGVLSDPGDPAAVTRLAELCWLISEFWLASVEVSGQSVGAAQLDHGVALMLQVLAPFIR